MIFAVASAVIIATNPAVQGIISDAQLRNPGQIIAGSWFSLQKTGCKMDSALIVQCCFKTQDLLDSSCSKMTGSRSCDRCPNCGREMCGGKDGSSWVDEAAFMDFITGKHETGRNNMPLRFSSSETDHFDQAWQQMKAILIICMDHANVRNASRITGGDPRNKICLLLDFTDRPGQEAADPWYTGDFEAAWQDVLEGCEGLIKKWECSAYQ